MEHVDRLYVDSNIFIRSFEGTDELAFRLADLLVAGGETAVPVS